MLYTPIPPPAEVVSDFTSLKAWQGIPSLVGITTAPVVAPDGTLEKEPGYLPRSRLYYHQSGLVLGDISPTAANVEAARQLIFEEMLGDFPFVDDASRANALAALLLPFVRPAFSGPTPATLFDAPVEGTRHRKADGTEATHRNPQRCRPLIRHGIPPQRDARSLRDLAALHEPPSSSLNLVALG